MNRRQFLQRATVGTVAVTQALSEGADAPSGNHPLRLGLIGCGWYGMVDVESAFKVGGVEVVAICDVDSQHLADSAAKIEKLQGKKPKTFKLYQELLETPGLEAVIIATPPHWHALQCIAALDKGLDIYCEKPLSYDICESLAMVEAANRKQRIIQVGFQRRQSAAIQQVKKYIQDGKPGRIIQAEAQIHYSANILDTTPQNPPASLDWDLWCGPAPRLSYCPQVGHFAWRLEKEYGHGHLVDWGIHLIDATRLILGEGMPRTVMAQGGIHFFKNQITTPDTMVVYYDFATCPVVWRHRIWGAEEYAPDVANGIFLYGEKETIFVTDDRWVVIPRGKNAERAVNKASTDMAVAHFADFMKAVRERTLPMCTIEDAFQSTSTVKLAMISLETGTLVRWDEKARSISGDNPAAARLMKRAYRSPWQHPYQG